MQTQPVPVYYGAQMDNNSPYSQRIAQQAHGTVVYSSEMGGRGFAFLLTKIFDFLCRDFTFFKNFFKI